MSLRQVLRSKFKGDDSPKSHRKSKSHSDSQSLDGSVDMDDDTQSFQSAGSDSNFDYDDFKDGTEKMAFEQQLTQLQEQLVSVMIENQSLKNELKEMNKKQEDQVKLKTQFMSEKKRNDHLEAKIKDLENKDQKKLSGSLKLKKKDTTPKTKIHIEPAVDIASDLRDEEVVYVPEGQFKQQALAKSSKSFKERLFESTLKKVYEIMDDFSEGMEYEHVENEESDPLTGKKLKENLKRFATSARPYYNTAKGLYYLLSWKNPPYTLIVFLVYLYMVWNGWLLSAVLACFTFRLFIQFLIFRGWNVKFNFIEVEEMEDKETDESLGLSDKFNLVIEVATKVQNTLGGAADGLEKIKSLLSWRHPEASNQLFLVIFIMFVASVVLPYPMFFTAIGLMMGLKLFIIDNIYDRFPRIKKKYDTTHQMWLALPTDVQYEKRHMKSEIDRYILNHDPTLDGELDSYISTHELNSEDKSFCSLFSLPPSESPLPGWQGGKMCTLINREKSLASAFKSGKLYLTRSFLCFERSKTPSPKNLVIPLANIGSLEKAKPYTWLPGGGMSIEVTLANSDKSFIFGGLMNRDDTYDMICEVGMLSQLPWATGLHMDEINVKKRLNDLSKRMTPQQFKNLSIAMICDEDKKD